MFWYSLYFDSQLSGASQMLSPDRIFIWSAFRAQECLILLCHDWGCQLWHMLPRAGEKSADHKQDELGSGSWLCEWWRVNNLESDDLSLNAGSAFYNYVMRKVKVFYISENQLCVFKRRKVILTLQSSLMTKRRV